MSTINFYLKGKSTTVDPKIFLVYLNQGEKFKFYTRIKVKKSLWNSQRLFGKSKEIVETNAILDKYENYIKEIERESLFNDKPYSIETIENKFLQKVGDCYNKNSFFNFYDLFVENSKPTKTLGTIKGYGSTKTRLLDFCTKNKIQLTFEKINQSFYESLVNYFINDLELLNNTIGKHIKTLKTFLHYSIKNKYTEANMSIDSFKVFKEDIDIIYLLEEELHRLYNFKDLPENLEFIKDNFCFECFTGLRFSDLSRIQNENLKGDFLEFRTQKTKDTLFVPLNIFAKEIIEKYKGRFINRPIPPTISLQNTNENLKDIAEIAGITDLTIIEKFSGSKRISVKKAKCDFITTHTGRRTFICLSYEKGMPTEMIMKITGIKKWDTLKKYLKITEKSKLIKMNEIWNKNKLVAV